MATNILNSESTTRLAQCNDYRSFIKTFIEEINEVRVRPLTYAAIARRAGFSSRSFPRDVILGTKKLSSNSLYPMIKGLGIKDELAELFKHLVYLEQPETRINVKSTPEIERVIKNLKSRILKTKIMSQGDDPYGFDFFPLIYAACGTIEDGASFDEIKSKTKIERHIIENTMNELLKRNIVTRTENRFYPTDPHLLFQEMVEGESFRNFFAFISSRAAFEAREDFSSPAKLFFTSCFSVEKKKMPQFKSELRSLILKFVDEQENPKGDHVASLVCSFF